MFSIKMVSEFFAPMRVELRGHKKQRDDGDENQVSHRFRLAFVSGQGGGSISTNRIQPPMPFIHADMIHCDRTKWLIKKLGGGIN